MKCPISGPLVRVTWTALDGVFSPLVAWRGSWSNDAAELEWLQNRKVSMSERLNLHCTLPLAKFAFFSGYAFFPESAYLVIFLSLSEVGNSLGSLAVSTLYSCDASTL